MCYLFLALNGQYKNPYYKGNQIGDYEFYVDGEWDSSTCTSSRGCTPMDCHDPYDSSWELIGVYKETVDFGNDMFYEQLFKHQGYCLWDADKEDGDDDGSGSRDSHDYSDWDSSAYQFMQAMRNELPSGCTQIGDMTYGSESNYYIAIKPLSEGDVTLGVYTDSSCLQESEYSFEDYQNAYASSLTATGSSDAFDTWNANMDYYKVCQPCRAYNRQEMYQSGYGSYRSLTEKNDGQGGNEKNNFNCYDDAHYQNCNQCYKFETHSDMAKASSSDLKAASDQGTILLIKYNGQWYGNGTVGDAGDTNSTKSKVSGSRYRWSGSSSGSGWFSSSYSSSSKKEYGYGTQLVSQWNTTQQKVSHGYGSTGPDANSSVVSHSIAGGAALLLCGFALVKAHRRITGRRIELASEDGSKSIPPLV